MLDSKWAESFAHDWIDSWNSHDMERILSHYSENVEMSSPLIIQRTNCASGTLRGREAVRAYWLPSLVGDPPLRFELIDILVGINSITLYYRNVGQRVVAETLLFDEQRRVVKGMSQWSVGSNAAHASHEVDRIADAGSSE